MTFVSLLIFSLNAGVAAAADAASAELYLARLVPIEPIPADTVQAAPELDSAEVPESETLAVAGDMYSLWTSQLSMLVAADESPRAWQQFMGLGPTLAQAYRQLGLAAWDGGDLLEALRLLPKAHALDPKDPEVTRKLGYVYKETGQYEKALDLLFLASIETPDDYLVWLWLGDAQRLLGQYNEAYESMLMARDLAPPEQTAELQTFVDYTGRLGDKAPSWENFETHRNFAERHLAMRRIRAFIAEYIRALQVAPEAGVTEVDALQRRAFTNQQIGIQYTFLKEHDTAMDYYQRAADLYRQAGGALDAARNLNNIADAYSFLADREWLDTADLRKRGIEYREKALELTQQSGDAPYVRYVQGRLLSDLLEVYPPTADEVQDVRTRNQRELPRSGPIPDFSLSAVADGEIAYRLADGDLAGARMLIEMVLPYYEQSGYLEDSERTAGHYVNLAHIYEAQEHYQEAIRQAERALQVLESMRGMMVPDAFNRSGVLDTYRHASTMLVRASLAMDKPAEALTYFEQYEYQSRRDMLGAVLSESDAFSEYKTERELVEQRLPILAEELEAARGAGDADREAYLEERIAADTERLEWLKRDIDFLDEQKPQVKLPVARPVEDILAAWPDNITLAGYLTDEYGTVVLVIADKAVHGYTLPDAGEAALNEHADSVVRAIAEGGDASGPLAEVGQLLLAPIAENLQDEMVYVVTSNVMNTIPFEALESQGTPLVDNHLVAYAQSASHLLAAIEREPAPGSAAVVFAPEAGSPGAIRGAAALPQAELLSGEAATETRLRNLDSGARWVHLAAPADVHHPDVMLNAVKLASDDINDGLVHAAELFVSRLPASVVSLDLDYGQSADRTSGLRLSGLAEGFLQAGVPSIVVNLWPVQEAAGAFFLKSFYDNLGTMEKLAAFHAAQVATRAQFPEAAQWAAFTFRGDFR